VTGPVRPRLLLSALALADLLAIALAMGAAYLMRFRFEIGALETVPVAPIEEYAKPLAVLLGIVPLLLLWQGLYRLEAIPDPIDVANAVLRATAIGSALVIALTFFYRREGFQYSRLTLAYSWAISSALLAATHVGFRALMVARWRAGIGRRRTVIVGAPSGYLLERLRSEAAFGMEVVGFVGEEGEGEGEGAGEGAGEAE
jgi:FlaA1/EpsC-like NDP-sugar epimerase